MVEVKYVCEDDFKEFAEKSEHELETIRREINDEKMIRIEQHHATNATLQVLTQSMTAMTETQKTINEGIKEMNGNIAKQTEVIVDMKYQTIENTEKIEETRNELTEFKKEVEARRKDNASLWKWFIGVAIGGSGLTPFIAMFLK